MIVEINGVVFDTDVVTIKSDGKVIELSESVAAIAVLVYYEDGSASDGNRSEIDLAPPCGGFIA